MKTILLLLAFAYANPSVPTVGQVELSQFQVGSSWTWQYSEMNARTGLWDPYLIERYTVTNVSGSMLTIELSSDPPSATKPSAAHHKFIMDFEYCNKAKVEATARKWPVEFYTTSLTGSWSLVSKTHSNYVFTEKFNCVTPDGKEVVQSSTYSLPDGSYASFHIDRGVKEDTSWYLSDHPEFHGVLASKTFEPSQKYKAELVRR